MSSLRTFKKRLAAVARAWDEEDYGTAMAEVERLRDEWPGNPRLHVLWASLVQLQEDPEHDLDEAKEALQRAVALDRESPAAQIELGSFLDAVDDDPRAAAKAYAEGVAKARTLLIEALLGRARALVELEKRDEALQCVTEVLHTMRFESGPAGSRPEVVLEGPDGQTYSVPLKGAYAERVEELLGELLASRSA